MHRLFGKPKPKVEAPTLDETSGNIGNRMGDRKTPFPLPYLSLNSLLSSSSTVDKKIDGLNQELKRYNEQIKKTSGATQANLKKRAMDVLRRKRMYESQRDQLAGQQFNIDQTAFAINTVKDTQTTVAAMTAAAKTLKKEQKKINLNDLENMQDEMEDLLEDVGEISEILARSYGTPDGIEEEDLDAELAGLEAEWENEEIAAPAAGEQQQETAPSYVDSLPMQPLPNQPNSSLKQTQQPMSVFNQPNAISSQSNNYI